MSSADVCHLACPSRTSPERAWSLLVAMAHATLHFLHMQTPHFTQPTFLLQLAFTIHYTLTEHFGAERKRWGIKQIQQNQSVPEFLARIFLLVFFQYIFPTLLFCLGSSTNNCSLWQSNSLCLTELRWYLFCFVLFCGYWVLIPGPFHWAASIPNFLKKNFF